MNEEIKNVLGLLIVTLPLCAVMVAGWFFSPMYNNIKDLQRQYAIEYLVKTYWHGEVPGRQELMQKYHLTENDINSSAFQEYIESKTRCNKNLDALGEQ